MATAKTDVNGNLEIAGDLKLLTGKRVKVNGVSQHTFVPAANVPQVSTADGSDAATTQALANALKASHNALLTSLKAKGIVIAD